MAFTADCMAVSEMRLDIIERSFQIWIGAGLLLMILSGV